MRFDSIEAMSTVRVAAFAISLDGFGAGPDQSLENPLGVDNDFAARSFENIGAWILGRNMFAPSRGPWVDMTWKGWWGDNPPYHVPTISSPAGSMKRSTARVRPRPAKTCASAAARTPSSNTCASA